MKRKYFVLLATIVFMLFLSGCGESKELSEYRTAFDNFCTDVAELDVSINNIDASLEESAAQLLGFLDELNVEFQELAALDVPEEFSYMEHLADEASENMTLAVENYHLAFESEIYDADAANIAFQYYERAYKRIRYMITFMHGDVPEDENVQFLEE